jgi:hypothetical protein
MPHSPVQIDGILAGLSDLTHASVGYYYMDFN